MHIQDSSQYMQPRNLTLAQNMQCISPVLHAVTDHHVVTCIHLFIYHLHSIDL